MEAKLVILGPIDFLFGLPINLIRNAGQNKFEVDYILKNVTLWKKPELRYGHLCGFLEAKLVILGPIDFLFGLPINLIGNAWQYKFEVDILKNVTKKANLRPKTGQIPLLSLDINWHNSIIFHPILTFFILNCLFLRDESNGVQIKALSLLVNILMFGPIFAPRLHMGKIVRMDPKPP